MSATAADRPRLPDAHAPRLWTGTGSSTRPWALVSGCLVIQDTVAVATALGVAYAARFKAGFPLLETPPHTLAFYSSLAF